MTDDYVPSRDAVAWTRLGIQMNCYRQHCRGDVFCHSQMKLLKTRFADYINCFETPEQKEFAAGKVLWALKKGFDEKLPKTTGMAINHLLFEHPVADKEKVYFLNYAVKANLERNLAPQILKRLADINYAQSDNAGRVGELTDVLLKRLETPAMQKDPLKHFARSFHYYPLLHQYSKNVKSVPSAVVSAYAGYLFKMSHSCMLYNRQVAEDKKQTVSIQPLDWLMVKTESVLQQNATMQSLFGEENSSKQPKPKTDDKALKTVIKLYAEHLNKHNSFRDFDIQLQDNFRKMMSHIGKTYQFDVKEVKEYCNRTKKMSPEPADALLNQVLDDFYVGVKSVQVRQSNMNRMKKQSCATGEHFYRKELSSGR